VRDSYRGLEERGNLLELEVVVDHQGQEE